MLIVKPSKSPAKRASKSKSPMASPKSLPSSQSSSPNKPLPKSPDRGSSEALRSVAPTIMSSILSQPEQVTGTVVDLDCPICLDAMNECDDKHPLQCSNACGYNFCLSCIESLITSSKDDYGEASDGNMHVKVFLMCPNCRSDLSSTIRDTVLLRKADHIKSCSGEHDEELTASELRMREVMDEAEVKSAIADAKKREAEFFGKKYEDELDEIEEEEEEEGNNADISYEECGVEMDLTRGVHQSMRWPKAPLSKKIAAIESQTVDPSLLSGLEFAMSEAEQELVTELLTSGDTAELASAAEILYGVTNLTRQGKVSSNEGLRAAPRMSRNTARSSVFALIDEAKHIREETEEKKKHHDTGAGAAAKLAHPPRTRNVVTASQHRAAEKSIRRNMEYMKHFPLPVRMPKYVEISLHDPSSKGFGLRFCDDTWDGTLLDAYSKITIGFGGAIKKKEPKHKGVFRILNMDPNDDSYTNPRIDTDQPRVLVASVTSEAGQQGVVKGDVITHVDGEEFHGNEEALTQMIRKIAERNDTQVLRLVLNAERSTAEALKRRATIMD